MPNRVSGLIRNAATKIGISDVIVVLYDIDIGKIAGTRAVTDAQDTPSTSDGQAKSRAEKYLELLYYGVDTEEDSMFKGQPRGDRLGSVITDQAGRFSLEFGDEAFQRGDVEQRPDLFLIVAAPDHALGGRSSEAIPIGTPELLRLLHVSFLHTRNIGRQEEFLIEIQPNILERQNIGLNESTQPEEFAKAVATPADRKQRTRSALRKGLNIDAAVTRSRQRTQQAEMFSNQISAIPKAQRQSGFFVGGKVSKADVMGQVQIVAVESLKHHTQSTLRKPSARLRLSEHHLDAMGINEAKRQELANAVSNGDVYRTPVNLKMFCATLQERNGGTILERTADLLDPSRRKRAARLEKLDVRDLQNDQTGDGDGDGDTTGEPINPEEKIKELVMEHVATPQSNTESCVETDQAARVLKNLQTLQPPASPADITAFHDFTHLQIAFPDVWAEAFDRDVRHIMHNMHIEYKELEEEYSGDNPVSVFGEDILDIDPNELLDLREYTVLMQKLGADLAAVGSAGEVPQFIVDFYHHKTMDAQGVLSDAWPLLSLQQQGELYELARASARLDDNWGDQTSTANPKRVELLDKIISDLNASSLNSAVDLYEQLGDGAADNSEPNLWDLVYRAEQIISNPAGRVSRVQRLLTDLARRLSEPHSFRVFQKDSVNFGIMTTYRQKWVPGPYQVGDLVSTLPLAPGESRKYTKKESVKKTRAQKENESSSSTVKDERSITSRAISDIVEKASSTTNFQQAVGTQAGGKLFGFNVSATTSTQFQANQAVESQRVKKDFREAVRKSSQEFKNERAIEVSTELTTDNEFTSSGEISNPNNEITVTYLFYELERQYRVTEHLQRLTPVVMVAQEVPNPSDIDEDWLLAHEWILRRSLLDSGFADALDYVSEGLVADEVNIETLRDAFEIQKELVDRLEDNVEALNEMQKTLRDTLVQTSEREKLARVAKARAKKRRRFRILKSIFLPVPGVAGKLASGASSLGLGRRGDDPEALEARREALETRLKFLEGNLEDGRAQLTRAGTALENATEALTGAVEESFTKRNLVSQLRIHVKDNILHYMQMIWSYEPPDQRFFRLYDNEVSVPVTADTAEFEFFSLKNDEDSNVDLALAILTEVFTGVRMPVPDSWTEKRRLHEIADLDKPLGYKGNYMIFPLKECVYLTDYMMQDYVDDYLGLRDTDPVGGIATDEILQHAEEIWHDDSTSDEQKNAIRSIVQARLTSPRLEDELIVVPTGQLFIEALKGEHALLEDFKRQHRGLDVQKVNEEVCAAQLENLRKAARLVADNPMYEDPDADKHIMVSGASVGLESDV